MAQLFSPPHHGQRNLWTEVAQRPDSVKTILGKGVFNHIGSFKKNTDFIWRKKTWKNLSYQNSHVWDVLKKIKRTNKNQKLLHFSSYCFSLVFIYYVSYMTIWYLYIFLSSFQFLQVLLFILRKIFNHHKKCSFTNLPGSTDQFSFDST